MSAIEQELIEATGFTPRRNYPDRQDYLAAVARAVDQLQDVDFEGLSAEAADWFNAAARALSNKKTIADFPDADPEAEEPAAEPAEEEAQPEEAVSEEELAEPETEALPEHKPEKRGTKETNPKFNRPYKGDRRGKKGPEKGLSPKNIDKWGVIPGTKNAVAISHFEKGATMHDVTKAIGGTYYNLIQDMIKRGHRVEKGTNGLIKLTHKDNIKKSKK
jgi:hypothetical protein